MWSEYPNLRHLRAFLEVAQQQSVSRAAERVHLSQPAITQAIVKLERQLRVSLFERRPEGMYPTEPGRLFLDRIERVVAHLETGARETLRIGLKKRSRGFAEFDRLITVAQLRALTAISATGNFSLAAREAGISQPSIHRAARDLERLAGVALFLKTSRGIELTEPAQALVRHARLAFAELRQGFSEIGEWLGHDSGSLVIGSLPLARTHALPTALNALTRDRPHVNVSVLHGPYDDLLYGLRHGQIDILIGALRNPPPIADVVQTALFEDPLAILARSGHPLARGGRVSIGDLKQYPWVIPPPGAPSRAYFDQIFDTPELRRQHGMVETSSLVLVRGLLTGSDRLTIMSGHQMMHEIGAGQIVVLPVALPDAARPIGITLRQGWRPTATQQAFLEHLRLAAKAAAAGG